MREKKLWEKLRNGRTTKTEANIEKNLNLEIVTEKSR